MTGGILFLAHRVPYPPNRGDKIRSWNILKALTQIAPVHVCALCDDERDLAYLETLKSVSASVHFEKPARSRTAAMAAALIGGGSASVAACASPPLQGHVNRLMAERDISTIFAFSGQMAQFVPHELAGRRFVMDFVDMDSAKFATFAEQSSGLSSFANRMEAKRLFAWERSVAQRADLSLFVSEAEAALFRSKSGLGADVVQPLENGIDLQLFTPSHPVMAEATGEGLLLVFTGQMDYAPNVDAVEWFVREAMPRLGNVRFAIVGRSPTERVKALSAVTGVTVTGEVADPRDWIAAADMIVAPLLLARGIQNKILEAMAMGKTVVSSPAAAEGIDAVDGQEFIIANDADAQAFAISELLASPQRRLDIGSAARRRMEARYGWEARLADLPRIIGLGKAS